MTQQPAIPMTEYADGTFTHVMEAQRNATVEQIVIHQGVPMGPRGEMGPTGPTGPKGESTEWTVGLGDPPAPDIDTMEIGDIYLDMATGDVWVLSRVGWVQWGNIMGPTGPTGATGAPANLEIGVVVPGGPGEAAAYLTGEPPDYVLSFVVPAGPTGPSGPPPTLETHEVFMAPVDTEPDVVMVGSYGHYLIDWHLPQGPTGPAGTNIQIVGDIPYPGPPPVTGSEWPGMGWQDSNGDVWVWSSTLPGWVNVGPVIGPTGPTGATGPGWNQMSWVLALTDTGLGTAYQHIENQLGFRQDFPFVRVLLEDPPASGMYVDAQSVYVQYVSNTLITVYTDPSFIGKPGRVVVN